MPFFRKKPVVIQAVQLNQKNWGQICDLIPKESFKNQVWVHPHDNSEYSITPIPGFDPSELRLGVVIKTLEGDMLGIEGDWVIKGVNGEVYPCKPDIFEKTYETV